MIDDDVITRLVDLHDHITPPATDRGADALRGRRMLRRRRTVVSGAVAAAVVATLGVAIPATTDRPRAGDRLTPAVPGPGPGYVRPPVRPPGEWPLEEIRTEGRVEREQVLGSGLTVRIHVLCDGSADCAPNTDGPLRRPHEQYALEVSQGGRSALFRIRNGGGGTVVTAYDDATVLVTDPLRGNGGVSDLSRDDHSLLRPDGTSIRLRYNANPAPAAPRRGVVLISPYGVDPDNDSLISQIVVMIDDDERTLRPLDMPTGIDQRRTWGPNLDEQLWFVTHDCEVHVWTPGGTFETRSPGCADGFDPGRYSSDGSGFPSDPFGNPGIGDVTWVDGAWFPDGWPEPGRMAFLERDVVGRDDRRLTLHVTLDGAASWQQVTVRDEAAIPDALRRLG